MNKRLTHLIATRQATPRDLEGISPDEVRAVKSDPNVLQLAVKSGPAEVVNEERRVLRYVWTDESVDSDGDIITLSGWDLTRYLSNPVFLWGHDGRSQPPIGKGVSITMDGGSRIPRSFVDVEYAPKEAFEFADTIYQLAKRGFVNATSAGFRVLEIAQLTDKQRADMGIGQFGIKSLRQQLFEISNVSMPANENALRAELKCMVDKGELDDQVRRDFEKTFPLTERDFEARLKEITRSFVDMGRNAEPVVAGDVTANVMPLWGQLQVSPVTQPVQEIRVVVEGDKSIAETCAKLIETNTRLVSAISDLTKRIAVMGDVAGGARAPDAVPSEARSSKQPEKAKPAVQAVDIESVKAAADGLVASVKRALESKT